MNETGEITDITFLPPQRVSFVLRLRQSFPEDCARLKLSSARASQAGLKEMMMQMKSEEVLTIRLPPAADRAQPRSALLPTQAQAKHPCPPESYDR